ncbi:MAG: substrate-binding domain-containing protein [Lachnospiraceae bacterium]
MKKTLCLLLTGLLTIGALTGCGNSDNADKENTSATEETSKEDEGGFDTDSEITVVSREDGSGTRGAFIELFGVEEKDENDEKIDNTTEEAVIANSTAVMMTTVAGDDYAIGYASLGSLDDTTKALKVDGVEPSVATVKDGSYKISRPFNIATKDEVSDVTQDFINFIMSADGQAVVEENGYIAVSEGEFTSNNAEGKIVIAGSSSVTPVMEKLKEAYLAVNDKAEIEIQESDSTTGMTAAMEGTCDIGMASRDLKDSESELTATAIAMDGIAVIVNNNNTLEEITSDQVKSIFVGDVTNWSEL